MSYEYEVQGNYGDGWDTLTTTDTRAEASQMLRTYQDNDYQVLGLRIKRVRVQA